MNISPTLLIIVPTLNSYKVLPRLIKSLKNQSFNHWRLLFVDGSSSISHKRWIEECCEKDSRINYINQTKNYIGIFGAMNQGLHYASDTDWILFWGSDDWAFSHKTFANLMSTFDKYKKNNYNDMPHLIIGRGLYINSLTGKQKRLSN